MQGLVAGARKGRGGKGLIAAKGRSRLEDKDWFLAL
jgi:hypothetical protein